MCTCIAEVALVIPFFFLILQHAEEIATMGIDLVSSIKQLKIPHKKEEHIEIRVGIHTGMYI